MVLTPASRSLHPAPGPSPKTQGPGEGAGKPARPCLLAARNTYWTALSLPPAARGSRRLTRAPRRPRGGCGLPGRVPVVTPARVCPIHSLRRPWISDREPRPNSVRRVVPGLAPGSSGCGRVSAPTHRPPGLASRGDHGPGPEKECRPHTHRRRSFWKQGGGASFPSESRCPSQPSPGLASRPLHTRTRAHTRAQKHRPTCTSAPRIALALRGQVRGGGTAGTGPWGAEEGSTGLPAQGPGKGGAAAAESSAGPPPIPRAGGRQGPELGPRSLGQGKRKAGARGDEGW